MAAYRSATIQPTSSARKAHKRQRVNLFVLPDEWEGPDSRLRLDGNCQR